VCTCLQQVSTLGSSIDTLLSVFTGSSLSASEYVVFNDDCGVLPGATVTVSHRHSCVTFTATVGVQYYIQVDGYNAAGAVVLNVQVPPVNDLFVNRITLTPRVRVSGSSVGAVLEGGEPVQYADAVGSVWYRYVATSSRTTVTTADSNFDTVLAVYKGPSLSNLATTGNRLARNDDCSSSVTTTSCVTFSSTSGKAYFIQVAGFNSASGTVSILARPA